jgi:hypothetical protein
MAKSQAVVLVEYAFPFRVVLVAALLFSLMTVLHEAVLTFTKHDIIGANSGRLSMGESANEYEDQL